MVFNSIALFQFQIWVKIIFYTYLKELIQNKVHGQCSRSTVDDFKTYLSLTVLIFGTHYYSLLPLCEDNWIGKFCNNTTGRQPSGSSESSIQQKK